MNELIGAVLDRKASTGTLRWVKRHLDVSEWQAATLLEIIHHLIVS